MLLLILVTGFELDRVHLRPERMLRNAESEWSLSTKRQSWPYIDQTERIFIGNSILHSVRDSLEDRPRTVVYSVPGEYAMNLHHWEAVLAENPGPQVVICLGINDALAGWTPAEIGASIDSFATRSASLSRQIVVTEILPVELGWSPYVRPRWLSSKIRATNARLEQIARQHEHVSFLSRGYDFPESGFTRDGVHLNDTGKNAWLKTLRTGLGSLQ